MFMYILLSNGLGYGQYYGESSTDFKPCTGTLARTW